MCAADLTCGICLGLCMYMYVCACVIICRHLKPNELKSLAEASEGMSGRNIRDICRLAPTRTTIFSKKKVKLKLKCIFFCLNSGAERRWAGKRARGTAKVALPPMSEYLDLTKVRSGQ